MAASRRYFAGASYRFFPTDHRLTNDSVTFELDESEIWNSTARSQSPELRNQIGRNPTEQTRTRSDEPASKPVNVPDWANILKSEYGENRQKESGDVDDYYREENGNCTPPHEFLARTRIASFSVHEGIGRTLKGRDLSTVRNAVWQKFGFQD